MSHSWPWQRFRTETSFEVDVAFFTKVVQSGFVGQRNMGWSWLCIGALKCPLATFWFITAATDAETVLCWEKAAKTSTCPHVACYHSQNKRSSDFAHKAMRYVYPVKRVSLWSLCAMAAARHLKLSLTRPFPIQRLQCETTRARVWSPPWLNNSFAEECVITLRTTLDDYQWAPVRSLRASDHQKAHSCQLEEINVARGLWMASRKCPSCAIRFETW